MKSFFFLFNFLIFLFLTCSYDHPIAPDEEDLKSAPYSYSVTYDDQGANAPVNRLTQSVTSPDTTVNSLPAPPRKTGWIFAGWYTQPNGNGMQFNTSTTVTANVTVYAKWKPLSYTVTFDGGFNANPESRQVISPATTVDSLPTPSGKASCFFFNGWWYIGPNGNLTEFTDGTEAHDDITVYAQWERADFTVSFNDQGALAAAKPTTKTVNCPATTVGSLPTPPIKTGYNFGGWFTQRNGGGTEFTATTVVTGNLTVYAKWNGYSYIVTYDDQGATTPVQPTTKTVASPATTIGSLPTPPRKTSWLFAGWYTQPYGRGKQFTANTIITADITVYALWNTCDYIVTFDGQGATTPANPITKIVLCPATTVGYLPTPPVKTGYTFGGWYTQPNGNGTEFTANTTVNGIITVYAKWNSCNYIITFDCQNATTPVSPITMIVLCPATTISTLPTPPSKICYIFGGWFTQPNGAGTEFNERTVVTANITVYANWYNHRDYIVTFNDQGATTPPSLTSRMVLCPETTVRQPPIPPVKTGYTFGGWYTQPNGGGTEFTTTTVVNGNIMVYAKWIEESQ